MPITESVKPTTNARPVLLTLSDFLGGLNADQSAYPLALHETELADILNFKYVKTPQGVKLRSRDGLTKVNTTAFNRCLNGDFATAGAGGDDVFASWTESKGNGAIANISSAAKLTAGSLCNTFVWQGWDFSPCFVGMACSISFTAAGDATNQGRYEIWDSTAGTFLQPDGTWSTSVYDFNTGVISVTPSTVTHTFTLPATGHTIVLRLYCPLVNGGYATYDDVSIGPGPPIYDIFGYTTAGGTAYTCLVSSSDLNYLNGTTYTKIGDLSSTRGRMCQFNDKLIIADGGVLKYWDGTTFSSFDDSGFSSINSLSASPTGIYPLYSGSTTRYAEYLTMPVTIPALKKMVVYLRKNGSPPGTCTAKIWASDGTSLLATSDAITCSTLSATGYNQQTFTFPTPIELTVGTSYYVGLDYSDGGSSSINCIETYIQFGDFFPTAGNNLYYYDGSWHEYVGYDFVFALYGSAPSATFAIQKQNRVYCNHVDYPNRLYYCNANDPNDWSTEDGGGHIIFDGHHQINALAMYLDEIYIFCDQPKAVYRMTGDSPLEYTVKKLFVDVTAISQDAVQNVGTDLLFLDTRGVISMKSMRNYGDIEKAIASRNINKTYLLPYTGQITAKLEEDNQFWMTISTNKVAVLDIELGVWSIYQFDLGTGATPTAFGIVNGITYIGGSDGSLYYVDYTKDQDNGVDFNLLAKSAWLDFNTLMVKTSRFADSLLISLTPETYDLQIYTDFNNVTPKKTLSMVSLSQNGAFHSPYCGNLNEVNFNFNQIQFQITNIASGTGPHWLDRIILEGSILSRFV